MDDIFQNTVSAENQVHDDYRVKIVEKAGAKIKLLMIGNSIIRHEPKEEIGWFHDWGMAASDITKDFAHVTIDLIEKKLGQPVNYCIVHLSDWEKNYWNDDILNNFEKARDYKADIVISRIGENCWGVRDKLDEIDLFPHFDKMVKYFISNPNAQVICSDLFWPFEPVDKVIHKVWETNPTYKTVKLGDLGVRDDCKALNDYWHSGVRIHPNDLGMRLIAERLVEKVEKI